MKPEPTPTLREGHKPHAAQRASESSRWPVFAAAWAFLFAVPSVYWALGGDVGIETIAAEPDDIPLIDDPAVVFLTGVVKVVGGLLALALGTGKIPSGPRRWLRRLLGAGGAFLLLYGGALVIQHGLMVVGAVDTPELLGERAARWHLFFWDPFWMLGGTLFLLVGVKGTAPRTSLA